MLYLITNRNLVKTGNLYSVIEAALLGGVDRVILREKDLSTKDLLLMASLLSPIIKKYNSSLIINTNFEVAKALNVEGFHIGFQGLKKEYKDFKGLFGVSVHSLDEAMEAVKFNADYLLASHIYKTDCKKGLKPKGLKLIEDIKKSTDIPVIALGGIDPTNIEEVLTEGAHGVAVMSYIMASPDPYHAASKLKSKINNYKIKTMT